MKFGSINLLISLRDYEEVESHPEKYYSIATTIIAIFLFLWLIECGAYAIYNIFPTEILNKKEYRTKFSRHTMDVISMIVFACMGFEALRLPPFNGWEAIHTMKLSSGKIASAGYDRSYVFSEASQRLCVWQVAYQLKNFVDALLHNDGPLFLAHHVVTGLLSALALKPFLHIYCAYFLGVSEISTAILCGLVLFDNERGVPLLASKFPALMRFFGVSFVVAFIVFRILLWPYASYHFWQDMLAMLKMDNKINTVHSLQVAYTFMIVNFLLTALQFYWLLEIVFKATAFFSHGNLSMKKDSKNYKLVESKKKK